MHIFARKAKEEEERKDEGSLFKQLNRPQQQHEARTSAEPKGDDAKETKPKKETDIEGKTKITLHTRQPYCFTLEVPSSATMDIVEQNLPKYQCLMKVFYFNNMIIITFLLISNDVLIYYYSSGITWRSIAMLCS